MSNNETNHREIEILKEGGFTRLKAEVGLLYGLCLRPCDMLADECKRYDREIRLKRKGSNFVVDGKSIIGLLTLGAAQGTAIEILVEGDDKEAEEIALRLYQGISTRNFYPSFQD